MFVYDGPGANAWLETCAARKLHTCSQLRRVKTAGQRRIARSATQQMVFNPQSNIYRHNHGHILSGTR